ncbi:MAG TPA: dihydroorotate dehydrogenase-like protein [Pirellulales bacterium]|nr:dihydroorotate dehydrogenase-like protein [Pirellulales bacterium]
MSVDLTTNYLGLQLKNPLVVSASPLTMELHSLQRLEDAGAAAVVLASLFEEQIESEWSSPRSAAPDEHSHSAVDLVAHGELFDYNSGPDSYLRHIAAAKRALSIPVIASLNGTSPRSGWVRFARLMEQAGADALELNVYFVPTRPDEPAEVIERRYVDLVAAVKSQISIPLAIKIMPFFSSLPNMAQRLVQAGANGLVLFNRFMQPDIDLDTLEVTPNLVLSSRDELRVPLRWVAILRGQVEASLAATGGIHFAEDMIKLLLAGADVGMLASALIRNGPGHLATMLAELCYWLEHKGFHSVAQIKGLLSQARSDSSAYERVGYMRTVISLTNDVH